MEVVRVLLIRVGDCVVLRLLLVATHQLLLVLLRLQELVLEHQVLLWPAGVAAALWNVQVLELLQEGR